MKASRTNTSWNKIMLPLAPNGVPPSQGSPEQITVDACATSLAEKREFNPRLIDVRELVSESTWEDLRIEANSAKRKKFEHYGRAVANVESELAKEILTETLPADLPIDEESISRGMEATFLFYETGEGLPVHLDNDSTYEYNLLICLDKTILDGIEGQGSATYFYLGNGAVKAAVLDPGNGVWFHAGQTPHGRIPLKIEREVTLLSVGVKG